MMKRNEASAFKRIRAAIRRAADTIAPRPEASAQADAAGLRRAYCGLLMEVARIESPRLELKRAVVGEELQAIFSLQREETAALIAAAEALENRYTSYYEPAKVINQRSSSPERVRLVEQLWRVAFADGRVDMYEDQLVRKLAELLHVAHTDFILAKQRARKWGRAKFAALANQTAS